MAVHQHIAHGEVLSQTHHRIVNRGVAVGEILTQHITDAGGGLLKGLIGGQAALIHRIKDPAVNRLQSVPDVGQGAAYDDTHGILNIGFFHFVHQIGRGYMLIREQNVLGLIITVVLCQDVSPP